MVSDALSLLGATYAFAQGGSLGIDGLSQSSSGPGAQVFAQRLADLAVVQEKLLRKFRKLCGMALVSGSA